MAAFDLSTLQIEPGFNEAVPDVKVWASRVICHLTKGYTLNNDTDGGIDPAITITAHMKAKEKELEGWRFAFIQLHKIKEMGFFYAGKAKSDGSIAIYVDRAPALPVTLCLDSEQTCKPWTRVDNRANYLFHIVDRRELWTVFTAQDPKGKNSYLAHVRWTVDYDFMFKWRKDTPQVATNKSKVSFDQWKKGAPTDGDLQPLLKNPGPPLANDLTREAIKAAVIGVPPNRVDVARSFANVFPDFYTPTAA
jgi:hypothetical protein